MSTNTRLRAGIGAGIDPNGAPTGGAMDPNG